MGWIVPEGRTRDRGRRKGKRGGKRNSLLRTFGGREAKKWKMEKKVKERERVSESLRRVVSVNVFRPQRFLVMQGPEKR